MRKRAHLLWLFGAVLFVMLIIASGKAMPPSPGLIEQIKNGEIAAPYAYSHRAELLAKGVDSPDNPGKSMSAGRFDKAAGAQTGKNVLCILVKFSDKNSVVDPVYFDTLIFFDSTGTVRNYYKEVSYGSIDIVTVNLPSSLGWQTAPQTYAYYCNNQNGLGSYPQNSQKLVEDLVDLIDPIVNYADYDNNGDGYVDGLLVVHTGSGAELTGNSTDFWSHKWGIIPRLKDGKLISTYTVQPEYWYGANDMTCGVFSHELGHALFGLPDLYDVDYSSNGIGRWSIMAAGSWNGTLGSSPAHYDAWCRYQSGFTAPNNVITNITNQAIPNVEENGVGSVFRLWTNGSIGNEYFLIENRHKIGYDSYIPSEGLLIWHIDEGAATGNNTDNSHEWYPGHTSTGHYRVALEQADGLYELEKKTDNGDTGDPFPGSTVNRTFSNASAPSSDDYTGTGTLVSVSNISNSGTSMTADLAVSLAADVDGNGHGNRVPSDFSLQQNFPNPFNPVTKITFELRKSSRVTLRVYNSVGQVVDELIDGKELPAGKHSVDWVASGDNGKGFSSGVYYYQLIADDLKISKPMLLVK